MKKQIQKVFLGGTCAKSNWRGEIIKSIQVEYFNPVVEDWTTDCIIEENYQKDELCNIHLYVITSEMKGVYSIAEVIDSCCRPDKITIFHVLPDGFDDEQLRSLKAVSNMCISKGAISYIDNDLMRTARVINYCFKQ